MSVYLWLSDPLGKEVTLSQNKLLVLNPQDEALPGEAGRVLLQE